MAVALVIPDIAVKSLTCLIAISVHRKIANRAVRDTVYVLFIIVYLNQREVVFITVYVQAVKVHICQEFAVKATVSPELVTLGFDVTAQFAAAYLCGGPVRQ